MEAYIVDLYYSAAGASSADASGAAGASSVATSAAGASSAAGPDALSLFSKADNTRLIGD